MKLPSTRIVLQGKVKVNRDWQSFLIEVNNSETMEYMK